MFEKAVGRDEIFSLIGLVRLERVRAMGDHIFKKIQLYICMINCRYFFGSHLCDGLANHVVNTDSSSPDPKIRMQGPRCGPSLTQKAGMSRFRISLQYPMLWDDHTAAGDRGFVCCHADLALATCGSKSRLVMNLASKEVSGHCSVKSLECESPINMTYSCPYTIRSFRNTIRLWL